MLFNLNSNTQMQEFLYNRLELTPLKVANDKGNISVAEEVLVHFAEKLGIQFCKLLLDYRKLFKAKNTYIDGIKRKITLRECLLHPDFWLNVAETYRSSSSNPNFQNIPKHGSIIEGFAWSNIRKMFTALGIDWLLGEVDYVGAEVKIAALLTGDKVLIADLLNDMDMHSHWANVIFGLDKPLHIIKAECKDERFLAKNNFTFANLFGAGFRSIAEEMRKHDVYYNFIRSIWEDKGHSNQSWNAFFIEYSEHHIQECQEAFYERYKGVKKWQDDLIAFYRIHGYVENPLGFRRRYPLKSTEIINYPIQSTSFLILLQSLIELDDRLIEDDFESHICGQIHDSGFFNIFEREAYEVMQLGKECLTKCHYPFQKALPLEIEWELGRTWFDMEGVKQGKGRSAFKAMSTVIPFDRLEIGQRFLFPNNSGGFRPYVKDSTVMALNFGKHIPFQDDCLVRLI